MSTRSMLQVAAQTAHRLEHDVVAGVDLATSFLLHPLMVDFRGWSFGDQRNETWM